MTPKTFGGLLVVGLIIALCLTTGCMSNELRDNADEPCNVYDKGEGVLYFGCTNENFAEELTDYLNAHKDVKVAAMSPATESVGYNTPIKGYFVITEPKE